MADNYTVWSATCIYPLSGSYTSFQRLLYYVMIVFAFCVRFHDWLFAVALFHIINYTSTAAIHALGLGIYSQAVPDSDDFALVLTLGVGCITFITLAMFRPRIFDTSIHVISACWSIFLTVSSITLLSGTKQPLFQIINNDFRTTVYCDQNGHCNNPCATIDIPKTPFRSTGDKMVPFLDVVIDQSVTTLNGNYTAEINISPSDVGFRAYWQVFTIGAAVTIAMRTTLFNLVYPPATARNWIFRRIASERDISAYPTRRALNIARCATACWCVWNLAIWLIWPLFFLDFIVEVIFGRSHRLSSWSSRTLHSLKRRENPSPLRVSIAKWAAITWYVWACVGYILWLVIWVAITMNGELFLKGFEETEGREEVGQWSPWATNGIAILGCIIQRLGQILKGRSQRPASLNYQDIRNALRSFDSVTWLFKSRQIRSYHETIRSSLTDLREWWEDPNLRSWSSITS